jgi:undecaprenyl diphosphate synthase
VSEARPGSGGAGEEAAAAPLVATRSVAAPSLHVAIVMDGNGRWAQRRGLPRLAGHRAGAQALERVVRIAPTLGIRTLTVYGFSTENWSRPATEVRGIMRILVEFLRMKTRELHRVGVRLSYVGDIDGLPATAQTELRRAVRVTASGETLDLVLAVNYGGRWEIVDAARRLAEAVARGELRPEEIDEHRFAAALATAPFTPPDILIRPGGEFRLSNFLLWGSAYSELVVTDTLWPDFDGETLGWALAEFARRERRFGGLPEQ